MQPVRSRQVTEKEKHNKWTASGLPMSCFDVTEQDYQSTTSLWSVIDQSRDWVRHFYALGSRLKEHDFKINKSLSSLTNSQKRWRGNEFIPSTLPIFFLTLRREISQLKISTWAQLHSRCCRSYRRTIRIRSEDVSQPHQRVEELVNQYQIRQGKYFSFRKNIIRKDRDLLITKKKRGFWE